MAEETRNSENTTAESTTTKEETVKKENIIWKLCKYMIKGTGYLCLFLVPCLSYYLFEYVTGNLENISIFMAALNICWAYVLYLVLTGITGTTRISVPVVSIALLILSFAETFVVDFRDRPIMIWDVLAVRTAMTVSGNYEFDVTKQMIQAAKAVSQYDPLVLPGPRKRPQKTAGLWRHLYRNSSSFCIWLLSQCSSCPSDGDQYVGGQRHL